MTDHGSKPPVVADANEVAEWAENLSDAYLACRDRLHRWKQLSVRWSKDERAYEQTERCTRCRAEHVRLIDSAGYIVASTSPIYPEGYLRPAGAGRLDVDGRAAIRLVGLTRSVQAQSRQQQQRRSTNNKDRK